MLNNEFGQVKISNEVVSTIAGIAAVEVDGAMAATSLTDKLFGNNGVKITVDGDIVIIDVIINVLFGYSIPDVGAKVQENIINTVETMTGLRVTNVNVFVQGISHKKEKDDNKNKKF